MQAVAFGRPGAVAIAFAHEPGAGALDQLGINIVDASHVLKFHQAVGGQCHVSGRAAKPIEAAARNLFVHRHTLEYRLNRVEALLGADPKTQPTRLFLELALALRD